jgi:hypothetical protein
MNNSHGLSRKAFAHNATLPASFDGGIPSFKTGHLPVDCIIARRIGFENRKMKLG